MNELDIEMEIVRMEKEISRRDSEVLSDEATLRRSGREDQGGTPTAVSSGHPVAAPAEWRGVYPGMCVDPEICRGWTHCPRNYSCCE